MAEHPRWSCIGLGVDPTAWRCNARTHARAAAPAEHGGSRDAATNNGSSASCARMSAVWHVARPCASCGARNNPHEKDRPGVGGEGGKEGCGCLEMLIGADNDAGAANLQYSTVSAVFALRDPRDSPDRRYRVLPLAGHGISHDRSAEPWGAHGRCCFQLVPPATSLVQ